MADELMLEIVTPEKLVFSGNIEEITLPGTEGEFGVLRGHEAFLTSVEIGEMNFVREGDTVYVKDFSFLSLRYAIKIILMHRKQLRNATIGRKT